MARRDRSIGSRVAPMVLITSGPHQCVFPFPLAGHTVGDPLILPFWFGAEKYVHVRTDDGVAVYEHEGTL